MLYLMSSVLLTGVWHSITPAPTSWSTAPGSGIDGPIHTCMFFKFPLSHFSIGQHTVFLVYNFQTPPIIPSTDNTRVLNWNRLSRQDSIYLALFFRSCWDRILFVYLPSSPGPSTLYICVWVNPQSLALPISHGFCRHYVHFHKNYTWQWCVFAVITMYGNKNIQ